MINKIIFTIVIICSLITIVFAEGNQPTQQTNKIFLNPFYRQSMNNGQNYSYNITINPPDKISSVSSAIISFDVYISPTVMFNIWVNNIPCNTPNYTISTTYASSGQSRITFDCSNVITKSGTYTITLKPTQQNTGSITGWLDLTYMNDPDGSINIFGTDYQVNDPGKTFIQLLDNNNLAINNGTCFITIFYPSGTKWVDKSSMIYQSGSNGLYYYDFSSPITTGIYMIDVFCEYYTSTQQDNSTNYALAKGFIIGGNSTSLTFLDNNYLNISEQNYQPGFNTSTVSSLLMGHLDEGSGSTTTTDRSPNPTTGTHNNNPTTGIPSLLGRSVLYSGTNQYTNYAQVSKFNLNATEQYMVCFTFNNTNNPNGDRIIDSLGATGEGFRFSTDGGNQIRFVSDRAGTAAQTVQSSVSYTDSQWHTACGFANFTTMQLWIDGTLADNQLKTQSGAMTLINGISLASVSTGVSNFFAGGIDEVCYLKGTFTGSGSTPSELVSQYHGNKSCGSPFGNLDLNVTTPNVVQLNNSVYFNVVISYLWNQNNEVIYSYIYNYTGNKWLKLQNDLTYAVSRTTVSNQINSNISDFVSNGTVLIMFNDSNNFGPIDVLNLDQVRIDQIKYIQTPITTIRGGGELNIRNYSFDLIPKIPTNVWNNPSRNLTSFNFVVNATINSTDLINNTAIAQSVWTYNGTISTNILTQIVNAVWNFSGTISTNILSLISSATWNNANRNLTYTTDPTNYTKISEDTWNYTGRYVHGILA